MLCQTGLRVFHGGPQEPPAPSLAAQSRCSLPVRVPPYGLVDDLPVVPLGQSSTQPGVNFGCRLTSSSAPHRQGDGTAGGGWGAVDDISSALLME